MQPSVAGGLQESPQGQGERGELSQLPSRDAATAETSEPGCARPVTFDLLNMVVSYKRIAIYLEPMKDGVEVVRYLLGWKMPVFSLLCCILLNILFISLSEVAWFSLCLMGVSTPAALGYIGERCQGVTSDTDLQRKKLHAVQRRDLQTVHLTKQEAMLEVKGLLKQLDDLFTQACVSAESVYKVLYWESHAVSSMFYGALLITVSLLYIAPVGWVLAFVINILFLWNREFYRALLDVKTLLSPTQSLSEEEEAEIRDAETTSLAEQTPTPTSLERYKTHRSHTHIKQNRHLGSQHLLDLSPGSIEEAEEAEPDDEFKDAIEEHQTSVLPETPLALVDDDEVPLGTPDYDSLSENGLLSRNEPIRSKVSKLTEKLRKRYPTQPAGNCSYCNAVFSVLKKRKSCSNCGNCFCSRCCSYKVLKSSMGATAPEAQRETVFVCAACNMSLSKKE
ncbi:protrudin isoform X4 [Clupea harengus]|uniref:Protrudin n=1 Tax=Clupea harengus TaxID=7950 RepID=A0A6P8ETY7_CLUHA|nr:protrudin isoform X4 [Clupea harengus]